MKNIFVFLSLLLFLTLGGCSVTGYRLHQIHVTDNIPVVYQQKVISDAIKNALDKLDVQELKGKSAYIDIYSVNPTYAMLPVLKGAMETRFVENGMIITNPAKAQYRIVAILTTFGADLKEKFKGFMGYKIGRKGFYTGQLSVEFAIYPLDGQGTVVTKSIASSILGEEIN